MTWPPVKAWTSKVQIDGKVHFVAINYGGKLENRWVVLMSVIDSTLVLKVSWSQLLDSSDWECGWDDVNYSNSSKIVNNKFAIKSNSFADLSIDSGLTIPITQDKIRPWFSNN